MGTIRESVEVAVPVRTAYDQWTQFEQFPRFMAGVESVHQLDDTHLHWVAEVGGHRAEWDAEITEQIPDARIAWRSTSGRETNGLVTFDALEPARTLVTVDFEYETEGVTEGLGSVLGIDDRHVKADLERFRELIETQGEATGAWRGEVHQGEPRARLADEIPPGPGAEAQTAPAVGSIESGDGIRQTRGGEAAPDPGMAARDPAGGSGTGTDLRTGEAGLGFEQEDAAARERGV